MARLAPKTSISHDACKAACEVVPPGCADCWLVRTTLPVASSLGASAAPLAMLSARACTMRVPAAAMVGLTCCASVINSTSRLSPWPCHQLARSVSLPLCGSGACHCAGALAATAAGGPCRAQPPSASTMLAARAR